MTIRERLRAAKTYAAIVAAALASIATSPFMWQLEEKPANDATPPQGRGYRYRIETSHPERAQIDTTTDGPETTEAYPRYPQFTDGGTTFDGGFDFVLFSGQRLTKASIMDLCDGQGCCDTQCGPPNNAYLRIVGPTELPAWSVEARAERDLREYTADSDGHCSLWIEKTVWRWPDSLRLRYRVVPSDLDDLGRLHLSQGASARSGNLTFSSLDAQELTWKCNDLRSTTFSWIASADGVCETEPCAPPPGTGVKIEKLSVFRP